LVLKKYIASLLRMFHLNKLADTVRFAWHFAKNYRSNSGYKRQHRAFAFPPPYYIYETYAMDYRAYAEDGRQTAAEIKALLEPYLAFDAQPLTIVDWGCGPGRIVRHWPQLIGERHTIIGCDYNTLYIDWCQKHISDVQFSQNGLEPPLPLPEASADAVYGLSIFTHLSESNHYAWAAELRRILKPGGVLVLTVQGDQSRYKLLPAELVLYDKGELVVRGFNKEGHRLYAAFQPPALMVQLFKGLEVLRHIPGGQPEGLDGMQDTWVLQKPASNEIHR
jgi:SAM-dependent methyltransferase